MGTLEGNVHVIGRLSAGTFDLSAGSVTNADCSASMALARTKLAQDQSVLFPVPWSSFRVHDAYATNLPGTAGADDLGLIGGTFGTSSPIIQTSTIRNLSVTQYARFAFELPECYEAGESVSARFFAGMVTQVAGTSCTLDLEVYESDKEGGIGSDLYSGAAVSINSLTFANTDFTIDASALTAGDVLDCRITIAGVDAVDTNAIFGTIGWAGFMLDIRG